MEPVLTDAEAGPVASSTATWRTIVQPVGVAVVLAILVRFAIQFYAIPSASMAPTLAIGDRILVTPYGFLAGHGLPERGDVIVFRSPRDPNELLVKRVVAVPGDYLTSHQGRVAISSHTVPEPYLMNQSSTGELDSQIIPAGCYFVMGDNRGDSLDSRSWGLLRREQIVGRARIVVWSSGAGTATGATLPDGRAEAREASPFASRLFRTIH